MSHRKYGLDHLGCRTARRLVSPALALWLCSQPPFAARADLYFNPRFLADDPAAVADLSGFEKGRGSASTYRVDIYLNNGFMTTRDVTFRPMPGVTVCHPA